MFLLQGMLGLTVTSGMVRASIIDIEMFLLQGMLGLTSHLAWSGLYYSYRNVSITGYAWFDSHIWHGQGLYY